MINKDRVLKVLTDLTKWETEFSEFITEIERNENAPLIKIISHGILAFFLEFHFLCEDYISINLKDLNKYKINISAIDGMDIIKDSNRISNDFLVFYTTSRRLRNRLAHRYKLPSDEELFIHLKNNSAHILEIENSIKSLLINN